MSVRLFIFVAGFTPISWTQGTGPESSAGLTDGNCEQGEENYTDAIAAGTLDVMDRTTKSQRYYFSR